MFGILWFLLVASSIAVASTWILDNGGNVVITWLGYEIIVEILPAILIAIAIACLIFAFSYLLAKILSIKFPSFLKLFFKRNYTKQLEKVTRRHHEAFEIMAKMMLALEVFDQKEAENMHKRLSRLLKNSNLNNFFLAKIFLNRKDFEKSSEVFSRFGENKHAKILAIKSKFKAAIQKDDLNSAKACVKQVLTVNLNDQEMVKDIFDLCKKHGLHLEAEELSAKYDNLK